MPPLYSWKAEDCGRSVDVIRPFAEHDREPQPDELPESFPPAPEAGRVWVRVIQAPLVMKGAGWGAKGNWVVLLAAAVTALARLMA